MLYRIGSRGDDVLALQRLLQFLGYNLSADGIFGRETEKIVRNFQRDNNIQVDGIIGKQTSTVMLSAFLSRLRMRISVMIKELEQQKNILEKIRISGGEG